MVLPLASVSTKNKRKKPSLLLTLSAAGALILGGAGAVWFFTQGKPLTRSLPQGATVIPGNALFTISVTTDVKQWESLRGFGTKQLQAELDKNLLALRDRFLSRHGYDFQTDIAPWVGDEVTIAVLASEKNKAKSKPVATGSNKGIGNQPLLVVLPIKNPQAADKIFSQIKPSSAKTSRDRQYQNVKIKEIQTKTSEKYAIAVLESGKYLAVADDSKAIERAIDAQQQQATLATIPGFAENFVKVSSYEPFARFYLNVPSSAQLASALPNRQLPAQVLGQLRDHQGIAGSILLEPEGLRFKGVSWLKANSRRTLAVQNNAGTMQSLLPAQTMMLLSGSSLRRVWTDYATTSIGNPLAPINPDELRKGVKSITNMELERDLLSWMGGEFALSVVPVGSENDFRAALLFMVKVRDRSRAESAMKQLDETIKTQYQFKIESTAVAGKPIVKWIAPFGTLTASHGWMDDDIKFITIGAPITETILPEVKNPLAKTSTYQTAVPSTFNPGSSYFFLDVERTAKNFPIPTLFPNQSNILASTNTIGFSSNVNDKRSTQYEALIRLRKTGKPSPLPASTANPGEGDR